VPKTKGKYANTYLDDDWVGLIAHSENIVCGDEPKSGVRTLQVIKCLTKVTLSSEEERCKTLVTIFHLHIISQVLSTSTLQTQSHLLHLAYFQQTLQNFLISKFGVS
jgi:hypothetical protein